MDLKTLIGNTLKSAGLPEAWIKLVKAEKEEDVQPAVDGLKTLFNTLRESGKTDISKLMMDVGLKDVFDAALQSETDKRVTQALKTHEAKLREELTPKEEDKDGKEKDTPDISETVKNILGEALKPLQETVESLQKERKETDRKSMIQEALKAADMDPKYAKYVTGDTAENIKASVEEVKQDMVDRAIRENGEEFGKGNLTEAGDGLAEELAKEANDGTMAGDFVGMSQSQGES